MEESISRKRGARLRKKAQKSKHSPKNNTIAPRTRLKWPPPPCPLKLPINSWWGLRLFDERMNVSCGPTQMRSEEHTSELQSPDHLLCRLLLEKKTTQTNLFYQPSALAAAL